MTEQGQLHSISTFGKIPSELLHDKEITHGAVRCYAHMHWRYGSNHRNFESQRSMADLLGVSSRTIRNWTDELVAKDWIVVVYRKFDKKTGNFTTPYYHVFESQEACCEFRRTFEPENEQQQLADKPLMRERKLRKGKGGNPNQINHTNLSSDGHRNSSSDGGLNLSSDGRRNLSSDYPDSPYPDSPYPDSNIFAPSGNGANTASQIPSLFIQENGNGKTAQNQDPTPTIPPSPPSQKRQDLVFEAVCTQLFGVTHTSIQDKSTRGRINGVAKTARSMFETVFVDLLSQGWTPEMEEMAARALETFVKDWKRTRNGTSLPLERGKFGTAFLKFLQTFPIPVVASIVDPTPGPLPIPYDEYVARVRQEFAGRKPNFKERR